MTTASRATGKHGAGELAGPRRVVHVELHTPDLDAASNFYVRLLQWRAEPIQTKDGRYLALDTGEGIGAGVVQCSTHCPLWLPYVEVDRIDVVTERAQALGASVLFEPREGPAGWRSVIRVPAAGELALWQPKEWL